MCRKEYQKGSAEKDGVLRQGVEKEALKRCVEKEDEQEGVENECVE